MNSRRSETEITVMCMVCDGSKVLVQDRLDEDWPGIAFPGGHVEPEEAFTAAAVREVFEETGLSIQDPKLCGVKNVLYDDGFRYIVFLYRAEKFSGELRSSEEGQVYWVERLELPEMKLCDTMGDLLPVFLEDKYTEFFNRITTGGRDIKLF